MGPEATEHRLIQTITEQLHWNRGLVQTIYTGPEVEYRQVQTSTDQQASTFFAEAKLCTRRPTRQGKGSTAREEDKVN